MTLLTSVIPVLCFQCGHLTICYTLAQRSATYANVDLSAALSGGPKSKMKRNLLCDLGLKLGWASSLCPLVSLYSRGCPLTSGTLAEFSETRTLSCTLAFVGLSGYLFKMRQEGLPILGWGQCGTLPLDSKMSFPNSKQTRIMEVAGS